LARPLSSITAPSQPLTAEPITEGDGVCGDCEAEANKELPISVAAAASAVLDATLLVEGEHVARFRPERIGRQGQLNNVRMVPLVRPSGGFSFATVHAYAQYKPRQGGTDPFP
jgi:hypothetical protein